MEHLSERGIKTSFLQIRMFEPFPRKLVAEYLENAKIKVDVEMNYYGQLNSLLKERVMIDADYLLLKYNGRPMSCDEVYDALVSIWDGKAPRRQVLTHGA